MWRVVRRKRGLSLGRRGGSKSSKRRRRITLGNKRRRRRKKWRECVLFVPPVHCFSEGTTITTAMVGCYNRADVSRWSQHVIVRVVGLNASSGAIVALRRGQHNFKTVVRFALTLSSEGLVVRRQRDRRLCLWEGHFGGRRRRFTFANHRDLQSATSPRRRRCPIAAKCRVAGKRLFLVHLDRSQRRRHHPSRRDRNAASFCQVGGRCERCRRHGMVTGWRRRGRRSVGGAGDRRSGGGRVSCGGDTKSLRLRQQSTGVRHCGSEGVVGRRRW